MRPRQLCRKLRDNLEIGETSCELHHPTDTFLIKSLCSKFFLQLSRHLRDNLLSIGGTLVPKHFSIDTFADMPIHQSEFSIDIYCNTTACLVDYLPQVVNQRHNIVILYSYAVCH